jgi:hypothetical protein
MGFVLALENVFASCVSIDDLAVAGWRLLSDISLFFPAPTVCHFFLKKGTIIHSTFSTAPHAPNRCMENLSKNMMFVQAYISSCKI